MTTVGAGLRRVAVVGFGTIGQRWAVAFAHAGLAVSCYDPEPGRWAAFESIRAGLEADLAALRPPQGEPERVRFSTRLDEALAGAEFVQENGPERLALKQDLIEAIEAHVPDTTLIASSSSALPVSAMQARCRVPGRVVLGHPFNPAHLMPLVEIVGGERTDPAAVEAARDFYAAIGKKPVVLRREITGHLALRLMGAMWREAIALVRDGVASAADVDRAFCYGPGPKWTLQGSFLSNALNAEGMGAFLEKYGPTYQAIWDDLSDATLEAGTAAAVTDAVAADFAGRSLDDLRSQRDRGLVAILRTLERDGAL